MATRTHRPDAPPHHTELDRLLDDIGWGVFLLMTGLLWMAPRLVPSGTWLVGTGVLLLVLNAVRSAKGFAIHTFTLVLGLLALAGGLADLANVTIPFFALALVAFGVLLLARPIFKRRG